MLVTGVFSFEWQTIYHQHQLHIDNLVISERDKLAIFQQDDLIENCINLIPKFQVDYLSSPLQLPFDHDLGE